ncbi:hypothetical protein EV702DRAFT_1191630 [Suillus placidus]|uniref:Uncharacterized protein n=1 Tax=Suillus placidus TaxID=48579 RepID=A0A9P7D8R8_9AGAM|nr:hypothetical protein EV702DRAFT_1191630 [Suillus placidus]
MAQTKTSTGDQPRLNDRETTSLQSHVEEWAKASGSEQRLIFKAAAREAKILAPKMDKELLKQRKHWFHNHNKVQANSKAPTKLQKKWTARRVIEEECKGEILQQIREEIEEETGEQPEHKEVLRRYQPTMTAIMHRLDKKELQEAQDKANKWTNQAPDAAVQAKTARKKGEKMVKNFAKEMFDFNEQLGRGSSFMKHKDWQAILPGWEEFIGDVFDQDEDQDATLLGGIRRGTKPYHEFELDHLGSPMLLEMDDLSLETKKAMIRSFLTIHYSKPDDQYQFNHLTPAGKGICCGKPKVSVPWSDIMKGQSKFISSTYLPDNAKLVKPSKMLRVDANTILDYWWDRQETQVGPTFRFKAWMDVKGRMHSPVAEDSDGDADDESPRIRPTRKPSATTTSSLTLIPNGQLTSNKRPHDSSTEDESDKTRAEASLPAVKQRHHSHTDAEETYMPDD